MEDWEKSGTGVHDGKLTKNQYKVLKNSKKGLIILFCHLKILFRVDEQFKEVQFTNSKPLETFLNILIIANLPVDYRL